MHNKSQLDNIVGSLWQARQESSGSSLGNQVREIQILAGISNFCGISNVSGNSNLAGVSQSFGGKFHFETKTLLWTSN
jgi:hypothetical protein